VEPNATPLDPAEARAQALDEFHRARAKGHSISLDEICARHPEAGPELRGLLEDLLFAADGFQAPREESSSSSAEPDDADGVFIDQLGDFRILREIGRGGMGVVYEAEQVSLRRRVALKVLRPHLTLDRATIDRFHREALTIAKLRHPGIVEIHAVGEERGHHFFAMELIEEDSLARALERRRANAAESEPPNQRQWIEWICETAAKVADALDFTHRLGVIHRDVKPSNILLGKDGRVVLTDFGIARVSDPGQVTTTKEMVGTPHYLAPEQVLGRRDLVDARTDVYALGVTLFEMLTLRRPFDGDTAQVILSRIANQEPTPPRKLNPRVSRDLEIVCLTAMEKRREGRYATAAAVAEDLRRFLEYRPIVARPIHWLARSIRWIRRHPWPATAGVLGLLLLVGVPTSFAVLGHVQNESLSKLFGEKAVALTAAESHRVEKEKALFGAEEALKEKAAALEAEQQAHADAEAARKKAQEDRQTTRGALKSLMNVFRGLAPSSKSGLTADSPITVRELLDRALKAIEQDSSKEPEVMAITMNTIGCLELELGLDEQALDALSRALELREKLNGSDSKEANIVRCNLSAVLGRLGRLKEAAALATGLVDAPRDQLPSVPGAIPSLIQNLAPSMRRASLDAEAEKLLSAVVDRFGGPVGERLVDWQWCLVQLAELRDGAGKHEEAAALLKRAEKLRTAVLGPNHPDTIAIEHQRALMYVMRGDLDEGEKLEKVVLDRLRGTAITDHPYVAKVQNGLGWIALQRRDLEEAEKFFREAIATSERSGFSRQPDKIGTEIMNMKLVAEAWHEDGDSDKAEELLEFVQEKFDAMSGSRSPDALNARLARLVLLCKDARLESASSLAASIEPLLDLEKPEHRETLADMRNSLAVLHVDRGEKEEAIRIVRSTIDQIGKTDPAVAALEKLLSKLESVK